jgi:hypothetical protein
MWRLIYLGVLCLLLGFGFYAAVYIRSQFSKKLHKNLIAWNFAQLPILNWVIAGLDMDTTDRAYDVQYNVLKDLPHLSRIILLSALATSVLLFLLFLFWQSTAALFGSATIVLLAAASWIAVGSVVVYWATQNTFPVFTVLLLWAIAISCWNDNHQVRIFTENSDHQTANRRLSMISIHGWMMVGLLAGTTKQTMPTILTLYSLWRLRAAASAPPIGRRSCSLNFKREIPNLPITSTP